LAAWLVEKVMVGIKMQYEGGEKCGICGHVLLPASQTAGKASTRPTEIIPGFLYVGSYDHASRLEMLKAMDISHVLSVICSLAIHH